MTFILKKQTDDTAVKHRKNFLVQKKESNKAIIVTDIRSLFKYKANYYKPGRACGFWSNNYDEYGSNGDRNKTLLIEEYLNKVRP